MDIRLFAQVIWRHKLLVVLGLVVAIALAELSVVSVSPGGTIKYRHAELLSSTTQLQVTGKGFPDGRLGTQKDIDSGKVPDLNRLNYLTYIYAQYATGNAVRHLMLLDGPIRGTISADPVITGNGQVTLPVINLTGTSTSAAAAVALTTRAATALDTYVQAQQRANHQSASDRVIIDQVNGPSPATVVQPRSKTMPIVIFLAVMLAFVGLAFLLENSKTRGAEQEDQDDTRNMSASAASVEPQPQPAQKRRSA